MCVCFLVRNSQYSFMMIMAEEGLGSVLDTNLKFTIRDFY